MLEPTRFVVERRWSVGVDMWHGRPLPIYLIIACRLPLVLGSRRLDKTKKTYKVRTILIDSFDHTLCCTALLVVALHCSHSFSIPIPSVTRCLPVRVTRVTMTPSLFNSVDFEDPSSKKHFGVYGQAVTRITTSVCFPRIWNNSIWY